MKGEKMNNQERLAVIDEKLKQNALDHEEIKKGLCNIENKLDVAIEKKADKTELEKLDNRFWGVVIVLIGSIIGLLATAAKAFLGKI